MTLPKVPRCYECQAVLPMHVAGCSATARVSIFDIAHELDEAGSVPLPAWWGDLAGAPAQGDDESDDDYAARS